MPINANKTRSPWNEGYGIAPVGITPLFEQREVHYWDEREVAECLIEGKLYEGYEFDPNVSVDELALFDANLIIAKRNELLAERRELQVVFDALRLFYESSMTEQKESESVHGIR